MKGILRSIALILVLVMLMTCLGGCDMITAMVIFSQLMEGGVAAPEIPLPTEPIPTAIEPDPTESGDGNTPLPPFTLDDQQIGEIDGLIDRCKTVSYSTEATREEVEAVWDELDVKLDYVSDQISIAQVVYYMDTSNEEANQTYLDAYDQYLALADKANLLQKDMYEDSPVKEWFFEDWTEAEIAFLLGYTSQQVQIQAELNEIETQFVEMDDLALHEDFTQLYIRMVTLGNQMAKLCGYANYYDYRADMGYNRDYSAEDREQFRNYVKTVIMPAFGTVYDGVIAGASVLDYDSYMFFSDFSFNDYDSLTRNYLQEYIDSHSGSTYDHMTDLFAGNHYIITDEVNAYEGAFCTYLDYYDQGLCYFGPGYQSTSTVVHEMGHYYANFFVDDYTPLDLLETHSQGNEALLLAQIKDTAPAAGYQFLRDYELFDMMLTMIISTMVDDFESRIYAMESVEALTTADFDRIITEISNDYFGAYGGEEYMSANVTDMQWYIRKVTGLSPAYYISYATSVVSSMNLFALAEENPEQARELYRKLVEEAPAVEGYAAALESVGAASPFEESSFTTIVNLFD